MKTNKVIIALIFISFFSTFIPITSSEDTNQILGINITVSPNPIACGGSATVTATIERSTDTNGNTLKGIATLWDEDSGFYDGDDALDKEEVYAKSGGETTVEFKIHCDIKEGDCDLYGPSGNSDESGTNVYVSFCGVESAKVYVKCKQMDKDGEIALNGTDYTLAGSIADITIYADEPIENLTKANWYISYDKDCLEVATVQAVNPILIPYSISGEFTYDFSEPGIINFSLDDSDASIVLEGPIASINFNVLSNPSVLWDTTLLRCTSDSIFYDETGSELDVCLGGNHSLFIAPDDNTPPEINQLKINFTQGKITGEAGAITHDLIEEYKDFIMLELHDENNTIVAKDYANYDGSFELLNFWLDNESISTIYAYTGVFYSSFLEFIPTTTAVPYITPTNYTIDNPPSGSPGDTVSFSFEVSSFSDIQETYNIEMSNELGWNTSVPQFNIETDPMGKTIVVVNTDIPETTEDRTVNQFTITVSSSTYPENKDLINIDITSIGDPIIQPDDDDDEEPDTKDDNKGTPGFELILILIAFTTIIFFKKKK